jgi:hypothetical protein
VDTHDEGITFPMVKEKDLLERHVRLIMGAKKKGREGDPRKQKYAKLVARTSQKYEEIARARGIPVKPMEKDKVKE